MSRPTYELLKNLIDYAGLFPPARLPLERVIRNFAEYQAGDESWMLGTLIVRPEDLPRLFSLGHSLMSAQSPRWRIACVLPNGEESLVRSCLKQIAEFHTGYGQVSTAHRNMLIDTVELRVSSKAEVEFVAQTLPVHWRVFMEVAYEHAATLIPAIAETNHANLYAKFRTGGITSDLIPGDELLVDAIARCAAKRVRFKATAGLHHPIRAEHPLTYEQNAECGLMHGFLNVLAATAILMAEPSHKSDAREALQDTDAGNFRVADDGWLWRDRKFTLKSTIRLRTQGMVSFGSCSFVEPVEDLQHLHYQLAYPPEP